MPWMSQLFVSAPARNGVRAGGIDLDRLVYSLRKRAEIACDVYFPSLSSRTVAYKGMLTTMQLPQYFPDLRDERCRSAIAIVHSRFSTNTFPSWPLAHTVRFVAHNGEINTVRGNRNRMHAREAMLASAEISGDLGRLSPICTPGASDSASFDEVLELLHLGGRSLPHAVLMMIPEAWETSTTMDPAVRAFCQFHASLMEPWDGPACVTLHRRHARRSGLGPQRLRAWAVVAHDQRPHHPRQRERRPRRALRGPPPGRRASRDGTPGARHQGMRGRRPFSPVGRGQARRDHRRRRHRRRLPGHRASSRCRVSDTARVQPGAPEYRDESRSPWPMWPLVLRASPAPILPGARPLAVA